MGVYCCQRETCALFYCHLCKSLCLEKCGFVFSLQSDVVLDRGSSLVFFYGIACDILLRVLYLNLNYFCPNSLVLLLLCLGLGKLIA